MRVQRQFTLTAVVVLYLHCSQGIALADTPNPEALLRGVQSVRQNLGSGLAKLRLTYKDNRVSNDVTVRVVFRGINRRFEVLNEDTVKARSAFDGDRILSYDGTESAVILAPSKPNAEYLFDLRTLGITASFSPENSIERCLGLEKPKELKVVGRESLNGQEVWHVRVTDAFDQQLDFWVDKQHDFRVYRYRCELGDLRRESLADYQGSPCPALPREVRTTEYYQGKRLHERVVTLLDFDAGFRVEASMWSIEGLHLPVGTPVSDIRINRRIGYWDGKGLSEEPPRSFEGGGSR